MKLQIFIISVMLSYSNQLIMASWAKPKSEMTNEELVKREDKGVTTAPLSNVTQAGKNITKVVMKVSKGLIFEVVQKNRVLGKIGIGVYLDKYPLAAGAFYTLGTVGINGKSFDDCKFYLVGPNYVETGQFLCDNGEKSLGVIWSYKNGEEAMYGKDVGDPKAMFVTRVSTGYGDNPARCCHFRIYSEGKLRDAIILGKVMRGKGTVRRIQRVPVNANGVPVVPVLIKNMRKWDPNSGDDGVMGKASSRQTANLLLLIIIIICFMLNET